MGAAHPQATMTISEPAPQAVAAALCRLRDDPSRRVALAENAWVQGNGDFDPHKIRTCFLQNLQAARDASRRR